MSYEVQPSPTASNSDAAALLFPGPARQAFGAVQASVYPPRSTSRHAAGSGKAARGAMYQLGIGCLRSDEADQDEEGQACWPAS